MCEKKRYFVPSKKFKVLMSAKAKEILWEVTSHIFNQYFADFERKKNLVAFLEVFWFFGPFVVFPRKVRLHG